MSVKTYGTKVVVMIATISMLLGLAGCHRNYFQSDNFLMVKRCRGLDRGIDRRVQYVEIGTRVACTIPKEVMCNPNIRGVFVNSVEFTFEPFACTPRIESFWHSKFNPTFPSECSKLTNLRYLSLRLFNSTGLHESSPLPKLKHLYLEFKDIENRLGGGLLTSPHLDTLVLIAPSDLQLEAGLKFSKTLKRIVFSGDLSEGIEHFAGLDSLKSLEVATISDPIRTSTEIVKLSSLQQLSIRRQSSTKEYQISRALEQVGFTNYIFIDELAYE